MNSQEIKQPQRGVQATYQEALDAGRFMIQRCGACGKHVFFPRELCSHCGATQLEWVQPKGDGTVYAVTTVRRRAEAGGDYNVSLIDLDEGVRMMSRVAGPDVEAIRIGQRVRARVAVNDGRGLVVFDAIKEEGAPA